MKLCRTVGKMGYIGGEGARYRGVTTSSVNRLAVPEEAADLKKYLESLQNLCTTPLLIEQLKEDLIKKGKRKYFITIA
jgi:hypothetical protein